MAQAGGTKPECCADSRAEDRFSIDMDDDALFLIMLAELAAIRSTVEDAATCILDSAEGLLSLSDAEDATESDEAVMSIMTACEFHDLVGQRVTKITKTLDQVMAARRSGEAPSAPRAESGIVLDGPCLPGMGHGQVRIDVFFAKDT